MRRAMRIGERPQIWAAALLGVAVSATLALLFLQATRCDSSPFFVHAAPAEWITYPSAPVPLRPQAELEAIFTRRLVLETAPTRAQLALRLYRTGALTINGAPVPFAESDGASWKSQREADVAALLRAGENTLEVRVLARSGPPALWLALEGDGFQLVSDAGWSASLMGAEDAPARLARTPARPLAARGAEPGAPREARIRDRSTRCARAPARSRRCSRSARRSPSPSPRRSAGGASRASLRAC